MEVVVPPQGSMLEIIADAKPRVEKFNINFHDLGVPHPNPSFPGQLTAGTLSTNAPDQVIERKSNCQIIVKHPRVTIRQCDVVKILVNGNAGGGQDCLIEDCWITPGYSQATGSGWGKAIEFKNSNTVTAGGEIRYCTISKSKGTAVSTSHGGSEAKPFKLHHCEIFDGESDAVSINRYAEVSHNYVHHNGLGYHSHADFVQVREGGQDIWIHHNVVIMPHANHRGTSTLAVDPYSVPRENQYSLFITGLPAGGAEAAPLNSIVGGNTPYAHNSVVPAQAPTVNLKGHPNDGAPIGCGLWSQGLELHGPNPEPVWSAGSQSWGYPSTGPAGAYDSIAEQTSNNIPSQPGPNHGLPGPFTNGGKYCYKSNSPILFQAKAGNMNTGAGLIIENNWFTGGNTTIQFSVDGNNQGYTWTGPVTFRNNVIGDLFLANLLVKHASVPYTGYGNTWCTAADTTMYATDWDDANNNNGQPTQNRTIMGGMTYFLVGPTAPPGAPLFGQPAGAFNQ